MKTIQAGILQPIPKLARYLLLSLKPDTDICKTLHSLAEQVDGEHVVIGLGLPLIEQLQSEIPGLKTFPAMSVKGLDESLCYNIKIPSTTYALCCWLRGDDRGDLVHLTRRLTHTLDSAFQIEKVIDAFQYGESRDLTGYEDGTENPTGDHASKVALISGKGAGLDGSSFMAIQQWVHDLDHFESLSSKEQDQAFGRRKSDNQEMNDAPDSAHVQRAEQDDFTPRAFMVRRSMPWADESSEGLVFVAFGSSFDAFETILHRMSGNEDGIPDALFNFTQPISGSYFWCPPMQQIKQATEPQTDNMHLDLSALKL